jgi:hypothetical protein
LEWNLVNALKKMNQVGKKIYISFPTNVYDYSAIYEKLGKEQNPFPEYVVVHNMLYQLGCRPNVDVLKFTNPNIVKSTFTKTHWLVN